MSRRLVRHVHVLVDGELRSFGPGDEVPAEIADLVTNPAVFDAADEGPAQSDRKAAWVDHAVSQGADRQEAEAMTKDDLIATYSN
jgi:hypothetical protein